LNGEPTSTSRDYESTFKLCAIFGVFYFVQGINEPTEGLIAQPVRSLLKSWGHGADDLATFGLILAAPWYCKPLFGALTDFLPFAGYRRKAYLILATGVTAVSLTAFYFVTLPYDGVWFLLGLLLLPTIGVAFGDVVVDGLMVDQRTAARIDGQTASSAMGLHLDRLHRSSRGWRFFEPAQKKTTRATDLRLRDTAFVLGCRIRSARDTRQNPPRRLARRHL